ncbi:MAG: hypothetical protein V1841_01815 [Patescibacteria group bacterium]
MEEQKKEKNTGMAILAYVLFFIPLLTDAKNDPFVKYHVRQGLVLFIAWIVAGVLGSIFWIIAWILPLLVFVLWIIGIMNAANGQEKPVPVIGQFGEKINI